MKYSGKRIWGVLGKQQSFVSTKIQGQTIPLNANPLEPWDTRKSRYKRVDLVPKAEQLMENIQQGGVVSQFTPTPSPTPSPTATPSPTPSPTATPSPTPSLTPTNTPTPSPSPTATPIPFDTFDMTIKTDNAGTSSSTQFTLPTTSSGYDFDIDWGDSIIETYTGSPGNITHTYSSAGTYNIKISRTFPRIFFNNGGDKSKVLTVTKWGDVPWSSFQGSFWGCNNMDITATDTPILSGVTSLRDAFVNCSSLVYNNTINTWDTSTITSMLGLFAGCSLFNQPIGNWNVSNVTDFSFMFYTPSSFNQPLSGWSLNTTSNINMNLMFGLNQSFNQPIGNWNTIKVTNMSGMFSNAVYNQPLSGWNTSGVTTFNAFNAFGSINQDLSNLSILSIPNGHNFQFFSNSALSTENYSKLLISWANQMDANGTPINCQLLQSSRTYNATNYGGSPYSDAVSARAALVLSGWSISDGGQV